MAGTGITENEFDSSLFYSLCFLKRMDEPVNYSNFSLPMREKYVRLFQKYGVNAIFTGIYITMLMERLAIWK